MKEMDTIIREIRPEEYTLLGEFLYQAIYLPKGVEPRPGPWWIGRSCRSILRASAHVPATIVWLLRLEEKW